MLRENLERNFGFLVNDVARLLRTTFDRRVRTLGLTRSQWWVLTHLYRSDGITQRALADTLELEQASLCRLLDRLESNGWVRREPDPQDRRAKRVFLTEEVAPAMKVMRQVAAELRADAMAGLDDPERDQFVELLLKVKSNLTGLGGSESNGAARDVPARNGSRRAGARRSAAEATQVPESPP
ncbi:MAG: MarR family transcriptional regulator [Ectothiorhodospiraceae bacterium]|nr:MarR family transcriptional regulator [Ectothiorhodospiraceae bacterium]